MFLFAVGVLQKSLLIYINYSSIMPELSVCVLHTPGLTLSVNSFQVALQFEWRQEVAETMRTCRRRSFHVLQRRGGHMLLHVIHQPGTHHTHTHIIFFMWTHYRLFTM